MSAHGRVHLTCLTSGNPDSVWTRPWVQNDIKIKPRCSISFLYASHAFCYNFDALLEYPCPSHAWYVVEETLPP